MDRADTVPGFLMQSENFFLKFITGLQCGVSSKLLEYETDWYEVMEIILSRLQDEPESKERFEIIASRDLEYWARVQPGGEALNLKIRVVLEEKRYFQSPSGSRKTLRLVFNDRFSTQVLFHVRKKQFLKSLADIAAAAVADRINNEGQIDLLLAELPGVLIPSVRKSFRNCWTPRYFRTGLLACPPWCSCKISNLAATEPPAPSRPLAPPQPQEPPQPSQPSSSGASRASKRLPRKPTKKTKKPSREDNRRKRSGGSEGSRNCEKCCRTTGKSRGKVSTKINCQNKSRQSDSKKKAGVENEMKEDPTVEQSKNSEQVLRKYKAQLKQLKSRLKSYLSVNVKRLEKTKVDEDETPKRKSPRLRKLKERLIHLGKNKISLQEENIFEPRPYTRSQSSGSSAVAGGSRATNPNKFTESKPVKRSLRSQVLDSSSARKKRRHS